MFVLVVNFCMNLGKVIVDDVILFGCVGLCGFFVFGIVLLDGMMGMMVLGMFFFGCKVIED